MQNDEFKLKYPLFQSLIESGRLQQRRDDALARLHSAQAEVKAAQAHFHSIERECILKSDAVITQYQKFYPFNYDEGDQAALAL